MTVTDNGVGIEKEMLDRVFDLFTQIDRSRPHSRGGLGIGLTLVRQLVQLHGGRVAVHSDGPGKGSEFVVRLPAVAAVRRPPTAEPVKPATTPLHILIIEDHADARSTLQQLLTLLGHRVDSAADGAEGRRGGVGRPAERRPDRPRPARHGRPGSGAAAANRPGGIAVLLVALTGHASEDDRRGALDAGFDAHLAKPVDLEALNRLLADAAEREIVGAASVREREPPDSSYPAIRIEGYAPRSRSSHPPAGAAGPVFQRHAEFRQPLADLVGHGEVLGLAGVGAEVEEQLHQAADELVVAALRRGDRLLEEAEDLAQFLQDAARAVPELRLSPIARSARSPSSQAFVVVAKRFSRSAVS